MNEQLTRYIVYGSITIAIILILNELGYYWWRRLTPGEHWSHLRGEYIPVIEYPPNPTTTGTLNNQWRRM